MKPRILGVAQEVLDPGEWVSISAARILLGLTAGVQFYDMARKYGFERKDEVRGDGSRRRPKVLYRYSDLEACANAEGIEIGAHMRPYLEMIAWVDSLTEMPTVDEMVEHTSYPHTLNDTLRLIETRKYRGVPALREKGEE